MEAGSERGGSQQAPELAGAETAIGEQEGYDRGRRTSPKRGVDSIGLLGGRGP